MDEEKKVPADEKEPADVDEHEGEDGYGSVEDEDERASVDTREVLSNPG